MVEKDVVRRGYDEIADVYESERVVSDHGVEMLEEFLAEFDGSARILDAGCGQGTPVLRRIGEAGLNGVGVDFSREQLGLAAKNAPGADRVQGDMTRLPVADGTCDGVAAFHSLIHVPLEDHQTAIDEFARVLRPGGRLLVSEGPEEWSGTNPDWLETGVEMQWYIAGAEATREQLRNAGFTITDERGVDMQFADHEEHWGFFSAQL